MKHFFHGKLALQQRVLPIYRVPFFDLLASACKDGMSLFTGLPRQVEGIAVADKLQVANYRLGHNIHFLNGNLYLCYQRGLMRWLLEQRDRKSTRLNSSHSQISYAVFCLKKKKK